MTNPLRCLLVMLVLLALAPGSADAQTILPRNLGGGCGGTIGYPALQPPGRFLWFRVRRAICAPNAIGFPSVLMIGTRTTSQPIPFAPGVAPGCRWWVIPDAVMQVPGAVGGEGISIWLGNVAGVLPGTVLHMQALVTCPVHGTLETAVTDGWTLRFQ